MGIKGYISNGSGVHGWVWLTYYYIYPHWAWICLKVPIDIFADHVDYAACQSRFDLRIHFCPMGKQNRGYNRWCPICSAAPKFGAKECQIVISKSRRDQFSWREILRCILASCPLLFKSSDDKRMKNDNLFSSD